MLDLYVRTLAAPTGIFQCFFGVFAKSTDAVLVLYYPFNVGGILEGIIILKSFLLRGRRFVAFVNIDLVLLFYCIWQ